MDASSAEALRTLLEHGRVAALGTLHKDEPAVSMVPYALLPQGRGLVIHVSRLATHTADMQRSAAVSLMVMAPEDSAPMAQALQRVTIQGTARACVADDPDYAAARAAYLARFPQSEPMFGFGDFSLFVLTVRSVRFVAGFGAAMSIRAEDFAVALGGAPSTT